MKTRLMSTRYSGTRLGSTSRPASSATYQLRWTESRKSPRSCAYEVLKTKRTESDLLAAHRAEHALGPHGQDEQQHDGRSAGLESLREIDAGEQLDEPDGHAADQRARDRSEAAQHRSRERLEEIGRASCRERVEIWEVGGAVKKKEGGSDRERRRR